MVVSTVEFLFFFLSIKLHDLIFQITYIFALLKANKRIEYKKKFIVMLGFYSRNQQ